MTEEMICLRCPLLAPICDGSDKGCEITQITRTREAKALSQRGTYARNREKKIKAVADWYARNREHRNAYFRERYAKRKQLA